MRFMFSWFVFDPESNKLKHNATLDNIMQQGGQTVTPFYHNVAWRSCNGFTRALAFLNKDFSGFYLGFVFLQRKLSLGELQGSGTGETEGIIRSKKASLWSKKDHS